MIKLIIIFFIFLYSASSSVEEKEFTTKWGSPENYCENFILHMKKDDFSVVDIEHKDNNTVHMYLADTMLVNRYLNNQLYDSVIGVSKSL